MGAFTSIFMTPAPKALSKTTHPKKPNWITAHAIATELSIAEVERLWVRFQQMGCNADGELTEQTINKAEYSQDIFMKNILKKYMLEGKEKKITFQNFLNALKWTEQASIDDKIRAIYNFLSNGSPITKDLMIKILERVYPHDKGEPVRKIVEILFQVMDTDGKGELDEQKFVRGVKILPPEILNQYLYFQILPDEMKERLHKNLQEFRTESQIAGSARGTGGGYQPLTARRAQQVPPDQALREVAEKIYNRDWLRVANKLGFFTQDVEEIQSAFPNNPQVQVYQMLRQWKERDGEEAHSSVLENALVESNMTDAAIILTSY